MSKSPLNVNWFPGFLRIAMGLVLAIIVLGAKTEAVHATLLCSEDDSSVYYKVTFQGNFNKTSSPGGLPVPPDPVRFTQVIWVTHTSQVKFWAPGTLASPGVELVAELGATFIFNDEIIVERAKIDSTGVFPPGRGPRADETISIQVRLCQQVPLFTFLTMLDFSPDWFIGLSSYSLLDSQGRWIPSSTVNLYPYDAGTEEGTEYVFNGAPTSPHQPVASIKGKGKFSGATAPVARMKFELINPVNLSVNGNSSAHVTEGGSALSITATMANSNTSGSALSIPIQVRSSGTTAGAGDYTVASSISIADNSKSGTATFAATEDSDDEPTEKVIVELGSSLPGGVTAGASNVTFIIADNDATVVSLARSDTGAIAEGGAGAKENAEFTVTLSRALAAGERIDVPLVLSGTGVTADDLGSLSKKSGGNLNTGVAIGGSGTLTPTVIFQGGGARTATLILTPGDDDYIESDETLTVALGPDGSGANGFDSLGTNVGGGANPHSSSRSFQVIIESEDVKAATSPAVSISGSPAVITEGGTATFTLSADPKPTSGITVKVNLGQSGSFAESGQISSRNVNIGTGGGGSFTVTTVEDSTDEPNGSITATLASGSGYSIGSPNTASVTVNDNDDPPVPVVSISGSSAITEGGTATFTLSADPKPTSGITVKVNLVQSGSFAESGQISSRNVTIGTGGGGSFTVTTVEDSTDEPNGSITATLASGTGYSIGSRNSASVTVNDNDDPPVPVVSISGGTAITEGGTATFRLSADPKPTSGITVKVGVQSGSFAESGQRSVVIGTGGTVSLTVKTVEDSADEPDGSIVANILSSGKTYSVSPNRYSASVAVNDNDDPPVPVVSISGSSAITEGGTATFTLSAIPKPASSIRVKVDLGQSGNFAQSGQRSVTIGTGGTGSLTITTIDDSTDEPDGSIVATLAKGTGYKIGSPDSASVTVRDDDIPTVSISGSSAITEGGTATFTLRAIPKPAASITVGVSVQSGSFAQSGRRDVIIDTVGTGSFTVTTINDSTDEPNGAIVATLANGSGYSIDSRNTASVTVNDDDGTAVPVVSISGSPAVITEGGTATFRLSADPKPTGSITVKVGVQSGSFAESGRRDVVIGTGGTGSLTVKTVEDSTDEPDGSIVATLVSGSDYSIGSLNSASVAVRDNDDPPVPVVSISGSSAMTEGGTATFSLNAAPSPEASITVRVSVQSGSFAESGQQNVVIGTGGTGSFAVITEDDSTDEPDGSIVATLASGSGYSTGLSNSASVAVNDNDDPSAVDISGDSSNEPSPDRGALVAIYNAAGGGGWVREDNWNTQEPVTIWYGVVADLEGRVTGLVLEDNDLEGRIHGDIGELDKLEVLYMNDNGLEGSIPLAQLGALESLEELALWGNEGLRGTIPDELGKRVDRAALRKIKDVNGGTVLADWFTGAEAVFDYSGSAWSEVEVNGNGRVSGLNLSGVGLSGDITGAVWEFSALSDLDLSDNPGLSGQVPLALMNGGIEFLDLSGSGVCVPQDEEFGQWLDSIDFTDNENCGGDGTATVSTNDPTPADKPTPANNPVQRSESAQGSGGGCSVASGSGFKQNVPEFALVVFSLLTVFLAGRRDARQANCIWIK